MEKTIEIPFGAKDSELKGWEYTIPENMEAEIKDGKIIVREKESEDERIREAIESIIRVYGKTQGEWIAGYDMDTLVVHLRDAFAYLERQKEQQPAEWSEEDKRMIDDIIYCLPRMAMGNIEMLPSMAEQYAQRLKSLRDNYKKCNSRWKPRDEQMEALNEVINTFAVSKHPHENDYLFNILNGLRKNLKSL